MAYALAAMALLAASRLTAPPPSPGAEDPARRILREAGRPLLLPFVWQGFDAARDDGVSTRTRHGAWLLALLPRWVDGHLYVAHQLIFDTGGTSPAPGRRADRLLAGLAMLEDAIDTVPEAEAELRVAMAHALIAIADRDPAISELLRSRLGRSPAEEADRLLARAESLQPGPSIGDRRAFLTARLVAAALRIGDAERALAHLDIGLERLRGAFHAEAAEGWIRALERLRDHLRGDPSITLAELGADPHLEEVVAALRSR